MLTLCRTLFRILSFDLEQQLVERRVITVVFSIIVHLAMTSSIAAYTIKPVPINPIIGSLGNAFLTASIAIIRNMGLNMIHSLDTGRMPCQIAAEIRNAGIMIKVKLHTITGKMVSLSVSCRAFSADFNDAS